MKNERLEFNIALSKEDRDVIDELKQNNIIVSKVFKMFIRQYLTKIKNVNSNIQN